MCRSPAFLMKFVGTTFLATYIRCAGWLRNTRSRLTPQCDKIIEVSALFQHHAALLAPEYDYRRHRSNKQRDAQLPWLIASRCARHRDFDARFGSCDPDNRDARGSDAWAAARSYDCPNASPDVGSETPVRAPP